MPLDTVLCLDTSGSMGSNNNEGINQLKAAASKFLDGVEDTARQAGLQENVAIVEFGAKTQVLHSLSTDYPSIRRKIAPWVSKSTHPRKFALVVSFNFLGGVVNVNGRKLCPRIILMTDGKPTNENGRDTEQALKEVLVAAVLFGARWQEVGLPHKIPIACVGCGKADKKLLESIAEVTGGMYVMVQDMQELSTFFKRQVLLSRFIAKFAHDLAQLHSLIALQQFMRGLGEEMNETELRPLMALLLAMIVADDDSDDNSGNYPKPPPVGTRVRRGPDWKWGDQDKHGPGTIIKNDSTPGWVDVQWDSDTKNSYRYGKDSAYDVKVVDENRRVIIDLEGIQVGCRVIRGPDWKWGNQDGGSGNIGRVFAVRGGVVEVRWPNGHENTYRYGAEGSCDVRVHPADVVSMPSLSRQQIRTQQSNEVCLVM
ncbi:unnamed protein product [Porites evermanni]|uniref:E3 ubiquitin-protein ligase HERC2 n=1 Tax=Porites evermanni TaxID=104178 RepID=A0ABN8M4V9_9CNID|nr:unnamed protein product [Porites evermanni]